jgi:precorrin-2 methylase
MAKAPKILPQKRNFPEQAFAAYRRLYDDPLAQRTDTGWYSVEHPEVYIIGLGIPEIKSITCEALAALQACKTIFVYDDTIRFFHEFCQDVRAIGKVSNDGQDAKLGSFIHRVTAAGKKNGPVGFAVYGHPLLFESLTEELVNGCKEKKVSFKVIAGISTMDRVLTAMNLSIFGETGIVVNSFNQFMIEEPQTSSHIMVFKAFERPESLQYLVDYTKEFYPLTHKVAIVACENWANETVTWTALKDLPKKAPQRQEVFLTLVIPPCKQK